ncbi:uncharacterized protein LOC110712334 [Chenopodium quinoa]|uniref:uncharacterized protein LOC110712334 n=1 Tax=Chenopodium quinoa TaxID=63459 RepID=UPI000B78732D|nr:uncharacterized protein LOC110712334 [Chenopodium quinoa]
MFAWKILHNAIPTAALLRLKGLPIDPMCVLCGWDPKSVEHLFRDCLFTKMIWGKVAWSSLPNLVTASPFYIWFVEFVSSLADVKNWGCLDNFFGLCWAIWLTRNNFRFRSEVYSPQTVLDLASTYSKRSEDARKFGLSPLSSPPGFSIPLGLHVLRGSLHDSWYVSLVFDGAWDRGTHSPGAGWVFRDPISAQTFAGGAKATVTNSPFHSELLACLWGLKHASRMGVTHLQMYTDSMLLTTSLLDSGSRDIYVVWVLEEIRESLSAFSTCLIQKVSRSGVLKPISSNGRALCKNA